MATTSSSQSLSKSEVLSFQEQARQIEAEKLAKRRAREQKKLEKELKKKRELQARLVGPALLLITIGISLLIWMLQTALR